MTAHGSFVRARDLRKRFGALTAVDGVDFEIMPGEAFGVLGPNGAGKTSIMRMVGCVSPPTGGELTVLGMDTVRDGARIRARLGVCPQHDSLDTNLTVRENLAVYASYFGIPRRTASQRAQALLDFVQLTDRATDRIQTLSGGMKRRLIIARALVSEPELLLLDEPTTGLDPQARHLLWDRLSRLKRQGITLVLTTHYMDEAEQLCDRLVVLDHGAIIAEGSPQGLIRTWATREVVEVRDGTGSPPGRSGQLAGIGDRVEELPDRTLIYADDGDGVVNEVRAVVPAANVLVRRATLEDVFLRLTGRTLVEPR